MKNKNHGKLRVLVVGAGMYVGGRGTSSYGTVMPALNELYRKGIVSDVYVSATSSKSIKDLTKKMDGLRKITGTAIKMVGFPTSKASLHAYREVLSQYKPDCAIVVVPDQLHYKITLDLLSAGIHTLVVKPLTPTLTQAKKLATLADKNNVYAAVEFHKRYDEANCKLKDTFIDGILGDILYVHVEFSQRRTIPLEVFKNWAGMTNIFQYLGVHYVDLIYFVTGARPIRVLATGQKNLLKKSGIDSYDSIQAVVEWKMPKGNNFISTILTNWIDPNTTSAMSDQRIKVIGTNGRYESDQKNRGVQLVTQKNGIEDINPYFTQSYCTSEGKMRFFSGYGIKSITRFCEDALDIKSGSKKPSDFEGIRPTFKEALISTSIIEAATKSLGHNSIWINLGKI